MSKLVFLLEEPSMKEALKGLLPRLLPDNIECRYIPHEGKRDLEKSIPRKLRAWREPGVRFVVVRDQDNGPCKNVKRRLLELCERGDRSDTLIRIACRELESWFLGDLAAVEAGMGVGNLAKMQNKRKFRDPDRLGSPSAELKRLAPAYQKISGARSIGTHLDPDRNRSHSYRVFIEGLRSLVASMSKSSG